MKLKLLTLGLVLLFLMPFSIAIEKSFDILLDIPGIDSMKGEATFKLSVQNKDYSYTINNASAAKTTTWSPYVKWNLSAGDCEEFTHDQSVWTNFTSMATRMGDICDEVVKYTNTTAPYLEELTMCVEERGNCAGIMQERNIKIEELKARSDLYDACLSDKMSCQSDKISCLNAKQDLENEPDYSLWLGALGFLIGWLIWGRKKPRSEFGEDYGTRR